jgi:hypothetical protein
MGSRDDEVNENYKELKMRNCRPWYLENFQTTAKL